VEEAAAEEEEVCEETGEGGKSMSSKYGRIYGVGLCPSVDEKKMIWSERNSSPFSSAVLV
jgi:hypothetical protein